MRPESRNPRLTSIKYLGFWKPPEEPPNGRPLEPVKVQQWLQHQPNSQPSQNTFTNSQTRIERSRLTDDIIGHVVDVSGDISLHTSNTPLLVNEYLQRSRTRRPSFDSTPATSDRKTKHHDYRKYNEERPPDSLLSRDLSTIPAAGTDASPAPDKLPKRQNSHSIDNGKYPLTHNYGYKGYAPSHRQPTSIFPIPPATSLSQKMWVDAAQETQRPTRDIPSRPTFIDPSSSNTQRGEAESTLKRRSVLPEDLIGASETCIFWLFSPEKFSSPERHACYGRKQEISHIVTHLSDHHGLIRGRDPQYSARKYLASCQNSSPYVKAKGNCAKCSSLSEWNDEDFADLKHDGVAICLRCWRKFNKKEMKAHMAGASCDYNLELSKTKKVWVLYTAFCSQTQLPGKPPKYPPRRKLLRRNIGTRRQQDRILAPVDDLDTTTSMSFPSLATSTTGDSMELWHSPKLPGSWVQQEEADYVAFDYASLERNPSLRPTDRPQELAYQIPLDQHQKDLGYHPDNVDNVFNAAGMDTELNQVEFNDVNEMFE